MNTTKNQIAALQSKEAQTEKQVKIVSWIITGLLAVAGFAYCCKGAFMQIVANWNF